MKKYFVVADVHGFYDELMTALNDAGFDINNPDHIFVSCGDLLDRGRKPAECLEFVMDIPEDRRILVCGNHEDLLNNIRRTYSWGYTDKHNGTYNTICDLTGDLWIDDDTLNRLSHNKTLNDYFRALVNYGETKNYIFVHSWYPWGWEEDWRDAPDIKWERARWKNPFECWQSCQVALLDNKVDRLAKDLNNKTLVFGHWHTSWAHAHISGIGKEFPADNEDISVSCFKPFYGSHIIGLDACTAITHKINCIVLEDEEREN